MSRKIRFWALSGIGFVGFAVAVLIRTFAGPESLSSGGNAILTIVVIVAGAAALLFAIVAITVAVESDLRRALPLLREQFPDALVYRVYGETDFQIGVGLLETRPVTRVPSLLLLKVTPDELAFYTTDLSSPLARVPATAVIDIGHDMVSSSRGVPRATVIVTVASDATGSGRVVLPFLVMREKSATFLQLGSEQVASIVRDLKRQLVRS